MMQKLEKVLDLAIEALELYLGRKATVGEITATEVKTRKPRAAKAAPADTAASPFGNIGGTVSAPVAENAKRPDVKFTAEEALEERRRGQEVMGLFIRRYLKATPTGLDRAKKIINDTLGGPRTPKTAWQLEDILPEDWHKLIPIFEDELDKAGA